MFEQWTRDGTAFREGHRGLDLAYGREAAARFDLYRPAEIARPPLFVYIHGGYWQAITKEQNAQFAAGLVRSGFAVANLDYSYCPETPLPQIVLQIRAALNFLRREADNLGVDASRLHLVGHSAGAHLAAMLAADPDSAADCFGAVDLRRVRVEAAGAAADGPDPGPHRPAPSSAATRRSIFARAPVAVLDLRSARAKATSSSGRARTSPRHGGPIRRSSSPSATTSTSSMG